MLPWVAEGIGNFIQIFYHPTLLDKCNQDSPAPHISMIISTEVAEAYIVRKSIVEMAYNYDRLEK